MVVTADVWESAVNTPARSGAKSRTPKHSMQIFRGNLCAHESYSQFVSFTPANSVIIYLFIYSSIHINNKKI